jgi:hypothetical protein
VALKPRRVVALLELRLDVALFGGLGAREIIILEVEELGRLTAILTEMAVAVAVGTAIAQRHITFAEESRQLGRLMALITRKIIRQQQNLAARAALARSLSNIT